MTVVQSEGANQLLEVKNYATVENCIHRRRMEREAKAKVVASVWGADFVQFPAALADLPRSIWKKRLNSSYSSKSTIRSGSATLRGRFLTRIYLQEVLYKKTFTGMFLTRINFQG